MMRFLCMIEIEQEHLLGQLRMRCLPWEHASTSTVKYKSQRMSAIDYQLANRNEDGTRKARGAVAASLRDTAE